MNNQPPASAVFLSNLVVCVVISLLGAQLYGLFTGVAHWPADQVGSLMVGIIDAFLIAFASRSLELTYGRSTYVGPPGVQPPVGPPAPPVVVPPPVGPPGPPIGPPVGPPVGPPGPPVGPPGPPVGPPGPPVKPPVSAPGVPRFQNITATSFAGAGDSDDSKKSAYYPQYYPTRVIDSGKPGAALPYHFPGTPPTLRVFGRGGKTVDCPIVDVGPWNTHDNYWDHGARPQAETGTDTTGRRTNHAGLDLTPGAWSALGKTGDLDAVTDTVSWDFVSVLESQGPTSPVIPPAPAPAGGTSLQANQWPTQAECPVFYGDSESAIRAALVSVHVPWLMNGKTQTIEIHKKCAASLERVLNFIWEKCGKSQDQIHTFGYDIFDGSFNWRPIAGTSTRSVHSYAAAIDFNAAANPQHAPLSQTKFKEDSLITTAFKTESWVWGGDWSPGSIDAMHFQAARVR